MPRRGESRSQSQDEIAIIHPGFHSSYPVKISYIAGKRIGVNGDIKHKIQIPIFIAERIELSAKRTEKFFEVIPINPASGLWVRDYQNGNDDLVFCFKTPINTHVIGEIWVFNCENGKIVPIREV